jgi:cytochrome c2
MRRCWLLAPALLLVACGQPETETAPGRRVVEGDAVTGRLLAQALGCGACHAVDDLPGAIGIVGPPLHDFGRRSFIAGRLPNRPDELIAFLTSPPSIDPATAMPDMGLTSTQARDLAAWLYTLRGDGR